MRSADAATLVRTLMVFLVVYMLFIKINPAIIIFTILVMYVLDGVDGFLAVRSESKGKISFGRYLNASLGDAKAREEVNEYKHSLAKSSRFGPRMDVAGDRVIEYTFWITFTYLRLIPLFVLFIVVFRHSFVDAFMASRGTSSKAKTRFAYIVYSSNIGRGGINIVKFLAFAYFVLIFVSNYPLWIGYVLITILVAYILLRGVAEVYDVLKENG
jgi:phosphatidylglycerophosphate synthase